MNELETKNQEGNIKPLACALCGKNLNGLQLMKYNEKMLCFPCDFTRHPLSFQLIKTILECLEEGNLINAIPYLEKLDKLELRQIGKYELEDIPELKQHLKQSFFEHLFELNNLFLYRFK